MSLLTKGEVLDFFNTGVSLSQYEAMSPFGGRVDFVATKYREQIMNSMFHILDENEKRKFAEICTRILLLGFILPSVSVYSRELADLLMRSIIKRITIEGVVYRDDYDCRKFDYKDF